MKITLNLASRTYLNRRALYASYTLISGVLALLLVFSIAFHLRNRQHIQQLRAQLATLQQEAAVNAESAKETISPAAREKLLADVRSANEVLVQDSFRWTTLLGQLEEVVPEAVAISSIQPNYKESSLNLTGMARRVEDLQLLLDNLITSTHFEDVYLLQQARLKETTPEAAAEAISFRLVIKGAF